MCAAVFLMVCVRWNKGHCPFQISLACFHATPNNKCHFAITHHPEKHLSSSLLFCFTQLHFRFMHVLPSWNSTHEYTSSYTYFVPSKGQYYKRDCQIVQVSKPKIGSKRGKVIEKNMHTELVNLWALIQNEYSECLSKIVYFIAMLITPLGYQGALSCLV